MVEYNEKLVITYNPEFKYQSSTKLCIQKYKQCLDWLAKHEDLKYFIVSQYWVRNNIPHVIAYQDGFKVYELYYSESKQKFCLIYLRQWEYTEQFGNKKTGWRVITLNEISSIFNVVIQTESKIKVTKEFENMEDVNSYLNNRWKLIIGINPTKMDNEEKYGKRYYAELSKVNNEGHIYGTKFYRYYASPQEAFEKMMKFAEEHGMLIDREEREDNGENNSVEI